LPPLGAFITDLLLDLGLNSSLGATAGGHRGGGRLNELPIGHPGAWGGVIAPPRAASPAQHHCAASRGRRRQRAAAAATHLCQLLDRWWEGEGREGWAVLGRLEWAEWSRRRRRELKSTAKPAGGREQEGGLKPCAHRLLLQYTLCWLAPHIDPAPTSGFVQCRRRDQASFKHKCMRRNLCACPLGFCLATSDSTLVPPHWCPNQRCSLLSRCP
jgi:hypothetical protein